MALFGFACVWLFSLVYHTLATIFGKILGWPCESILFVVCEMSWVLGCWACNNNGVMGKELVVSLLRLSRSVYPSRLLPICFSCYFSLSWVEIRESIWWFAGLFFFRTEWKEVSRWCVVVRLALLEMSFMFLLIWRRNVNEVSNEFLGWEEKDREIGRQQNYIEFNALSIHILYSSIWKW